MPDQAKSLEMLEHYCLQPYRDGVELDAEGRAELTRMANSYGQTASERIKVRDYLE